LSQLASDHEAELKAHQDILAQRQAEVVETQACHTSHLKLLLCASLSFVSDTFTLEDLIHQMCVSVSVCCVCAHFTQSF